MKKQKIIIIGIFIALIAFAIIVLYKALETKGLGIERYDLSGQSYYQYFSGIMKEYSGKINTVQYENETQLRLEDGEIIHLDSTPIYYKDVLGKVLFPTAMELVDVEGQNYKTKKFANIINKDKEMYIQNFNKEKTKEIKNAFLYDGNDLYFFLEETTVKVGDIEYVLSPLSYVIVDYRQSVEIYDYEKDEYTMIQDEEKLEADIIAKNNISNYEINMSVDSIKTEKKSQLLIKNINNLQDLSI